MNTPKTEIAISGFEAEASARYTTLASTPTDKALRIAIVTETYPPEINGVAMTLGRLIHGLRQQGHSIQLVRPRQHGDTTNTPQDDDSEILVRGIPIPRYSGLQFGLPAGRRLQATWRKNPPDLVH